MSIDHATLYINSFGSTLSAVCNITHPSGLPDTLMAVLHFDPTKLATRIARIKDAMPGDATLVWAALNEPLAAPEGPVAVARFNECMERTIGEGASLYKDLADKGLATILEKINQMPEGSSLTINTDCAFLPWEILYPKNFSFQWDPPEKQEYPPEPKQLWGYRFITNYNLLDQAAEQPDWVELLNAHQKGSPFISLNLNPTITNTEWPFEPLTHHKDFYAQQLLEKKFGEVYDSGDAIKKQLYSKTQEATVLYFYCHGSNSDPFAPNNSEALEFEENSGVSPDSLKNYPNKYLRAPIVFLNSCNSASMSPLSFSSFYSVFREKNALGIIGTAIEMPATFGAAFGCRLLGEYLKGQQLGLAMYSLRRELVDKGNPLGLFYSLQCPAGITATI